MMTTMMTGTSMLRMRRMKENVARSKVAPSKEWATLWVVLTTAATLSGRRLLNNGFRMSIHPHHQIVGLRR